MKKMFCIDDDTERLILEIQFKYRINRSDIVRRGIHMLNDFLIHDKLPEPVVQSSEFTEAEKSRAKSEGIDAFRAGMGAHENPYQPGSRLSELWLESWTAATSSSVKSEASVPAES